MVARRWHKAAIEEKIYENLCRRTYTVQARQATRMLALRKVRLTHFSASRAIDGRRIDFSAAGSLVEDVESNVYREATTQAKRVLLFES